MVGFDVVGKPEERPVGKLEHNDEDDEPAAPDRNSRGVPSHLRIDLPGHPVVHPKGVRCAGD